MLFKQVGIPYMGAKRKIADKIVNFITEDIGYKYDKELHFWDLFGGGASMSLNAHQRGIITHYNELNTGVVELLKDVLYNGVDEKYYQFITREDFLKHKNDDTWLGGFSKVVFSFGNNQKDYIYGTDIEDIKHLCHDAIVKNTTEALERLQEIVGNDVGIIDKFQGGIPGHNIQARRLSLTSYLKKIKDTRIYEAQHLEHVQQLERVEHLERVQHLERVEHLERVQHLEITNLSYEDVVIPEGENSVIYLDPPYEGTAKYEKDIDHRRFFDWVREQKYPTYISSYEINEPRIELVAEFKHTTSFSATDTSEVIERLYRFLPDGYVLPEKPKKELDEW